ncbi:MAG TPA: hypothetical protein VF590_25580 [Isosphaeraceae bacterium]
MGQGGRVAMLEIHEPGDRDNPPGTGPLQDGPQERVIAAGDQDVGTGAVQDRVEGRKERGPRGVGAQTPGHQPGVQGHRHATDNQAVGCRDVGRALRDVAGDDRDADGRQRRGASGPPGGRVALGVAPAPESAEHLGGEAVPRQDVHQRSARAGVGGVVEVTERGDEQDATHASPDGGGMTRNRYGL